MQEILKKFVLDPEWKKMEEFIMSHFEHETDLTTIDTNKSSEAIHAEIIARQRIARNLLNLKASFETAKQTNKPKTSFK